MAKLFVIMGKSSTGKDTVYKELLKSGSLKPIVMYTTRPMREGETDGKEYFFTSDKDVEAYQAENKIIEMRSYNTVQGLWRYYTLDDGQIDRNSDDKYIIIATLQAYEIYLAYYGSDMVIPIYIEVDDKVRIHRAIEREDRQHRPDYVEMCRRFLADEHDFSEASIKNAGVGKRYVNASLSDCVNEILLDIDKIN